MTLEIDDSILEAAHVAPQTLKEDMALLLYKRKVYSLGQAASFLGIHSIQFQELLAKRDTTLNFSLTDWNDDLKTLANHST